MKLVLYVEMINELTTSVVCEDSGQFVSSLQKQTSRLITCEIVIINTRTSDCFTLKQQGE